MRSKNGVIAIGIIGLIVVIFTLAAFFLLDIEKISMNIFALAFLLLSEVVLCSGLIGLRFADENRSAVFLKAGVSTSLSLYFAATLITVFLAGNYIKKLNTFILIELAVIVLFAIVTISIVVWSRSVSHQNEEDMAKVGTNEPKRGGF